MPVTVDVSYRKSERILRDPTTVFHYLRDVEKSLPSNFPGLEAFRKVEPQVYEWKFEKISYGGHNLELGFTTRFDVHEPDHVDLASTPSSRSKVEGRWLVKGAGKESTLTFELKMAVQLPLPFFLKSVAAPIAQKEMSKLFDRYLANVAKALSS